MSCVDYAITGQYPFSPSVCPIASGMPGHHDVVLNEEAAGPKTCRCDASCAHKAQSQAPKSMISMVHDVVEVVSKGTADSLLLPGLPPFLISPDHKWMLGYSSRCAWDGWPSLLVFLFGHGQVHEEEPCRQWITCWRRRTLLCDCCCTARSVHPTV